MEHETITPFDWTTRDVLIGILRDQSQFQSCLEHRFYHIPKAVLAVKAEEVRYIALYQSQRLFGQQSAGVRIYGRIAEVKIVPRNEITEIPARNSGNELYCRFEIESWETLPHPVRIGGLSPGVSMLTSLFLLTHCRRVPELFLRTKRCWDIYSTLRAAADRTYKSGGAERLESQNDNIVMIAGQTIGVYTPDGYYEEYNLWDFLQNPHGFMKQMLLVFGNTDEAEE
jgi:hypothetical protein